MRGRAQKGILSWERPIVSEPERRTLYRQKRVLGVLLILQAVALVGVGVRLFARINWSRVVAIAEEQAQNAPQDLQQQLARAALFVVLFLAPTILLLLAGLSFLLLRRRGWILASVAQAVILLACLFSYSDPRPWFAYPLIAYSILMVLYLNSQSVRTLFHARDTTPASRGSEAVHGG